MCAAIGPTVIALYRTPGMSWWEGQSSVTSMALRPYRNSAHTDSASKGDWEELPVLAAWSEIDPAKAATEATAQIELDIEELPTVADRRASGRHDILLFEESGTNLAMAFTAVSGDADTAFREAAHVRRACFQVQRYTALPMEPRGLLAEWDTAQGRMTVLGAAKAPFFNRNTLAAMLGLAPTHVDLIENDVGGGFGARGEFYPEPVARTAREKSGFLVQPRRNDWPFRVGWMSCWVFRLQLVVVRHRVLNVERC
jgi:hypothetical protein